MYTSASEYLTALPEIFLLCAVCVILVVDLYVRDERRLVTFALTEAALLITTAMLVVSSDDARVVIFESTFVADTMSQVLKAAVCLIVAAVFLYSRQYLLDRGVNRGEYYVLGLFGVLGMMVMISAHNLLSMYLGLELLSLSLYAMVAFNRDSAAAAEAAMKYFVLGAIASGMLLYGMSIVYGLSGTLDVAELSAYLRHYGSDNLGATLALAFVVVALAFKLGAVPFHMWIPDVYEGAPTAVTLYVASAPKIAGFALVMRLLVDAMGSLHADWQGMLVILIVLSLAVGNIVAIAQTNIKRLLAYSTIAHIGYLLLGIVAGTRQGYSASMFYVLVYALMTMGAFGVVILLSRKGFESDRLDDLKGLNERSPWVAFIMLVLMFSMAGVPPMVGFHAKLAVLRAVVDVDLWWLAVIAVVFSIIGAFYYLKVVKLMYFDRAESGDTIRPNSAMGIVLSTNGLTVLALGIYPASLMALCHQALMW